MCCPFVQSSSPTVSRESCLMVLRVSRYQYLQRSHRKVCWVFFCLSYIRAKCLSWLKTEYMAILCLFADDSTLLSVVRKPAHRPAVAASINRDLAMIQEWFNHWCMILNTNKTKVSVVSGSRTVSPPHGDLVLSGVYIRASPYLDILGVKFDSKLIFEDHVRGIVYRISQRIGILRLAKHIFMDTSVLLPCYLHLFSQSLSIVLRCGGQLLNVTLSFLSASWCIRCPGFVPIRVSFRCVIDVVWLGLVCYTRLIGTLITVSSTSFYLLLLEFDILYLRPQLIHWSLKYQGVERPNVHCLSCQAQVRPCLIPERWMGSRVQSTVSCFP